MSISHRSGNVAGLWRVEIAWSRGHSWCPRRQAFGSGPWLKSLKEEVARECEPTYRGIIQGIAAGTFVHVDETRGVIHGGGHYMWVFANMTSVAYVYAPSR